MSLSFIEVYKLNFKAHYDLLFGSINTYSHIKSDLAALRSYAEVCCLLSLETNGSLIEMKRLLNRCLGGKK